MTVILLAASSAPSPLYPLYQAEFGFSSFTLTTVFAVYVLALLLSLLTTGQLSDILGRRPVLAGSLALETGAMLAFLVADGVGWLLAARLLQGVATGAALGVLGAYLLDLAPSAESRLGSLVNSAASTGGLGVGAIGTGLLLRFAPYPTRLVFVVLSVLFALLVLVVPALPETVDRAPGALASLRPKIAVPDSARRAFAVATPSFVATWALGGLILSIGGSLVGSVFGQHNEAVIGVLLSVFSLAATLVAVLLSNVDPGAAARLGSAALVLGTALFVTALLDSGLWLLIVALVVAGGGFGLSFVGALRSITRLARPRERAALLSAVYGICYLAFSVPALIAGLLIARLGLRDTVLYYGALVGLLALAGLAASLRPGRAE
ncbi:MAG TPA: MFS transporter [Pseudonocardiaceae bacterium]|jgi:MFS family permease